LSLFINIPLSTFIRCKPEVRWEVKIRWRLCLALPVSDYVQVGDHQREEICFSLRVQGLSIGGSSQYKVLGKMGATEAPHIGILRDAEHPRIYAGWIKGNSTERFVFNM